MSNTVCSKLTRFIALKGWETGDLQTVGWYYGQTSTNRIGHIISGLVLENEWHFYFASIVEMQMSLLRKTHTVYHGCTNVFTPLAILQCPLRYIPRLSTGGWKLTRLIITNLQLPRTAMHIGLLKCSLTCRVLRQSFTIRWTSKDSWVRDSLPLDIWTTSWYIQKTLGNSSNTFATYQSFRATHG